MSDDLAALDLDIITITRDAEGYINLDGGGLDLTVQVFMLRAAEHLLLEECFGDYEDEESEE